MAVSVKMSYNATTTRVKCELSRAVCLSSELPPTNLIERAKAKLDAVRAAGTIDFYHIFEQRLNDVWAALRDAADLPEDHKIIVTIAAGAPALPGIRVEVSAQEKAVALLSIDAKPEIAKDWPYEWFKLTVLKRLRDAGIHEPINNAQIYTAFHRFKSGESVTAQPLSIIGAPAADAKAFSVVANKQRHEIGVVIRKVNDIRDKANRDALLALIMQAVRQLSVNGVEYKILKKDFLTALQTALDGPEGLGVELPLVLLAAVGHSTRAVVPTDYPGAGRLSFEVSMDKMEATISGFKLDYYDDPSFQVGMEWINQELKRCQLVEASGDVAKNLVDAIARKENLNGMLAAKGNPGAGGKGPYLYASYQDAEARAGGSLDGDLDMREMQQRATVKAGQLVAELRYATAAQSGRNVYGDEVPPPANDELIIRVGDGIQERDGLFYATCDGIPNIESEAISLAKALVHEGDVNLRTGNIRFDGPVEIKGSIDNGAVVETTSDLLVHGTIRGAEVRAAGSITVKEGITTGKTGCVHARGDIVADFIENSQVTCGGNLTAIKAVINSRVIVGGFIKITGTGGVLAGGTVISKDSLYASNLGFRNGAKTLVNVGVDWRMARAVEIRSSRLARVQAAQHEARQNLRELVQRSKAQLTARHLELKNELQDRLTRSRAICERLEQIVQDYQRQVTYSSSARIYVQETLTTNVSILLCGQSISVTNEVIGVCVLPKRRRGSYIIPIEEVQDDDALAGNKAS